MLLHYLVKLLTSSTIMQIWMRMKTKCIAFTRTGYNLSSLITYCGFTYYPILVPVRYSMADIYLKRLECWQLSPAHWACVTAQRFEQATPLFTLPNLTFWKSVWSTAINWVSSSSEFISCSCITSMNWRAHMAWQVALIKSLLTLQLMSGIGIFKHVCMSYNVRSQQLSWQYQYLFSNMTWNI